ncbi:hypothetical protein OROMI_004375 [Orobanche minor]
MEDTTFFHMITISPKRNKPHFSFLVAELRSSKAPPATMAASRSFLSLTSLSRAPTPLPLQLHQSTSLDLSSNQLSRTILPICSTYSISPSSISPPTTSPATSHNNWPPSQALQPHPAAARMESSGLTVLAFVGFALDCGPLNLVLSFSAVCIWLRTTEKKSDNDEGKISQLIMPDYCDGAEAPC